MGIARGRAEKRDGAHDPTHIMVSWESCATFESPKTRVFALWETDWDALASKRPGHDFPFESRNKNRSAQLARLITNLPPCSRKTPPGGVASRFTVHRELSLEGRVPVRGVSRAIAGALPPLPRRNFLRRGDENAFFFRIGSSWTEIIDM